MKKSIYLLLLALLLLSFSSCKEEPAPPLENGTGESDVTERSDPEECRHVAVIDPFVAPTCIEAGKSQGEHCAVCGQVLQEQLPLDPLEHEPGEAMVPVPESCTGWGAISAVTCVRCGETLQEETFLPPAGHQYAENQCTVCGWVKIDYTDPKLYSSDEGYRFFAAAENGEAMRQLYDEMEENLMDFHSSTTRSATEYRQNAELGSLYKVADFRYTTYGLTLEEAQTVYTVFRKDHPLFYWMTYYLYWDSRNITITTVSSYAKWRDRNRINQKVYTGIEQYASLADGETSAYNIALIYYDAILKNNSYAYDTNGGPKPEMWAHGIVGAFLYGKFVCEGYAKLFQLLLNARDVENVYISGDAGGSHFWNLVRMDDGNWYWFDPTWGDASADPYVWFCALDDMLLADHTPTPSCQYGMYFNYILPERATKEFASDQTLEIGETVTVGGQDYILCAWNTLKPIGETPAPGERLIYGGKVYLIAAA